MYYSRLDASPIDSHDLYLYYVYTKYCVVQSQDESNESV